MVGIDIAPQPHYCGDEFHQGDALEMLADLDWLAGFDAIHASPPCQAYTQMSAKHRGHGGVTDSRVGLIAETRELLRATGVPYVIENVMGAKTSMEVSIVLHGGMFGLGVDRPRLFESNILLMQPKERRATLKRDGIIGVYGRAPDGRRLWGNHPDLIEPSMRLKHRRTAPRRWASTRCQSRSEVAEAIPPAYTEFISRRTARQLDPEPL